MRSYRRILPVTFILSLVTIVACTSPNGSTASQGNPDGDGGDNTGGAGVLTMNIDGSAWVPDTATAINYVPNTVVGITGSLGTLPSAFLIVIADVDGVTAKTYPLALQSDSVTSSYFYGAYSQAVTLDSIRAYFPDANNLRGSLTVTEVDFNQNFISGTFSMDLFTDEGPQLMVRITEGKFERIMIQ